MCRQGARRVTVLGTTLNSPFFVLAVREKRNEIYTNEDHYNIIIEAHTASLVSKLSFMSG